MQESKLINVQHGDRDSLGLFQQRPSQGWGTAEQILDPVYSTKRFYSALVKVPDYLTLPITEAAQAVQRSAFPNAYAVHEDAAIALAGALTGQSPGALTCSVRGGPVQQDVSSRLTAISDDVATGFGPVVSVTRSGDSLRIEVSGKRQRRHAWAVASYLVARARILDVDQVSVGHRGWQRSSGAWASAAPQDTGSVVVAARAD
jgi:hypothetical protein